jgi:hypothetical protein
MRSTAAYGALAATRLLKPRPASASSTWMSPGSIDKTGSQNVSAALTDWLATTGQPGDIFKLRRGSGFAPGAYWIQAQRGAPCFVVDSVSYPEDPSTTRPWRASTPSASGVR